MATMARMPRSLGTALPPLLQGLFDGRDLASKIGDTFLLTTTDAEGWPHVAMLSAGELVLAPSGDALNVGLWLHSTATKNLERDGRGLLTVVTDGAGFYLRLTAQRQADLDLGADGRLARFALHVVDVQEDRVNYATLTSGVTFRLHEPDGVVARWQRTVEALRSPA